MKKSTLLVSACLATITATSQINFDPTIAPVFDGEVIEMPKSPLDMQVIFIGGYDTVQAPATYGNPAGPAISKSWNDFIGFTADPAQNHLGWLSVNHERIIANDNIGDGGGMTVFAIDRVGDSIVVVPQTLTDGRNGKFFAVDFVNHTGETGMNCGGITSSADGRIWTAEEWFRGGNDDIADRDTSDFVIGTGTTNGQASTAGFPGFNGDTIRKYQNFNYMVEVDPMEAKAIRKQYNWGRQPFEGGCILPDNQTVYLGADNTPGFFTKFVADTPGDFTTGTTFVFKHDAPEKWVVIDNADLDKMLNFADEAVAVGATMFNRLEWVVYDEVTEKIYITETGRDNPGSRWADEHASGAVHAPHTMARAAAQGTYPDSSAYWDYYGRVLVFDPQTNGIDVFLEAGPYFSASPDLGDYPEIHLSNPDGLGILNINGQSYLGICEDLNGTSNGRVPNGVASRTCELYLLDLSIMTPSLNDLKRVSIVPAGAEVTGFAATPDGKTVFINSQHPSSSHAFPYNHSLTYAINGWDRLAVSLQEPTFDEHAFSVYPNPASREIQFSEMTDVALYDATGKRVMVQRNVKRLAIGHLPGGVYYVRNASGVTRKLIIQ